MKKVFLLSFIGYLAIFSFMSCKGFSNSATDQGSHDQGGTTVNLNVKTLKLWGHDIKNVPSINVNTSDMPKELEIEVDNCKNYTVNAKIGNKNYSESATIGKVKIAIADIPEVETDLIIKLSATGMGDFNQASKVKKEFSEATDLKVFFKTEDNNIEEEVLKDANPEFHTSKDQGEVIVKTTSSAMSAVKINTEEVRPSNQNNVKHTFNTSADVDVTVEVEFVGFKKDVRKFKVKKHANQSGLPLFCKSAKIVSGDNQDTVLNFDAKNSVKIAIGDVKYSTVRLEMEFNKGLGGREVKECKNQRLDNYEQDFTGAHLSGIFSGYITHHVNESGVETALTPINNTAYTEELIVGSGTVSYEIEVRSKDGNEKETYTIEIENTLKGFTQNGTIIQDSFMKELYPFEGSTFTSANRISNGFVLPFYSKGPMLSNGAFNKDLCDDLAYMEPFYLLLLKQNDTKTFCFYANIFEDEGGSPKDKHEFKRFISKIYKTSHSVISFKVSALDGKYLDCFASDENTLPSPMCSYYYGKKWRKISTNHGFVLGVDNKILKQVDVGTRPGWFLFKTVVNYRIQAMAYDEQNKSGGETKYLTIAKDQKFTNWQTGEANTEDYSPFLSGETGADKDIFEFKSLCEAVLIDKVECTIKKNDVAETGYENIVLPQEVTEDKHASYKIGVRAGEIEPSYEFVTGEVYKVEIKVTYKNTKTDRFQYILDYKNTQTLNLMDLQDELEESSNLFGVPTSYGIQMLDSAILY